MTATVTGRCAGGCLCGCGQPMCGCRAVSTDNSVKGLLCNLCHGQLLSFRRKTPKGLLVLIKWCTRCDTRKPQ